MAGINQIEFDQIFIDWYYPVRNFIYYKTGNMQEAEDITQDTFLKLWEKKEKINKETAKSLLYTIANNLFLNKIEHSRVVLKFVNDYDSDEHLNGPDFDLEMKEFDLRLQDSLAQLDENNRSVFLMNRIDGMTYVQIAESLGLSVKAVEKRMGKAISFLKEKLNMRI
jgi:RNA polymerase sigma-70 factor (family 1)